MISTIVLTIIITLVVVGLAILLFRPIAEWVCFAWYAWCMGAFARSFQVIALCLGLFLGFLWGSYYERKNLLDSTRDQQISVQRENINNSMERTENDNGTTNNRTSP